ncbi:DEAD/DEAH box helicase [Pseudomonadota bacterium]|nr:DEAD/DEAH box helicase [Alphaproteobacteria bacterium]MDC0457871.1 DEAD/DEAH box helicase [Alphaproteobacteria bacterium]MDC1357381.1 DEAD/DEAH box helicase [Pseudomonadota bacterium]
MLETSLIPSAIINAMKDKGYEKLTPVQEEVGKKEYAGSDLLVSAQTGSGKTIAFGIAIVDNLTVDNQAFKTPKSPEALIIVPTRELALQVKNELSWLLASSDAKIVSCVGGMDIRTERRNLETKPNIVVGTPGRLKDHIERNYFNVSNIKTVVLDEADEMLDMGFREDLEAILESTPEDRQTLMFSATVPRGIANLAKRYQKDAVRITAGETNAQHVDIEYRAFKIVMSDQENAIINTLRFYEATNAIIFCATRIAVNHMTSRLTNRGISAVALSGELSQNERNMALQAMRTSKARVCVATDVAARGLDLPNLDLVIHADIPRTSDTLLHRSGRTGRAGRKGVCAVLVPQSRTRMAERLFGQANIKPIWASTPSREEILKQDKIRIVDNAMLKEPIKEDEQEFVDLLVSKNTVEQLAAAYYRLLGKDLSAPEDLRNPSDRDEGRSKGNGFQKSVWFELSVGRDDTAEPRWLVAMLCKAGNLSKRDIGSIKIQPKVTNIEISEETSSALKQLASNRKPIERHIMIRLLDKPPEGANSDRGRPDRNRSGRGKPDYNRANEGRSRDFKGKGKSDRWQSSEKKKSKPKFSPFADNYIQQDENSNNEPQDKLKSSSRRGKQKESYANADRNHNKNDFKDKRNNKKVKPKSKNERLPNFENNFNEEDKLKEFNANREKKSFKGKKSNNDTLRISKKNKDIKSTAKSKFPKPKKSD